MEIEKQNIMVDIETLGQNPAEDAILSIAALKFDSDGIYKEDMFHEEISRDSCAEHGMGNASDSTKKWWEDQEATYTESGKPLCDVLREFSRWTPDSNYYFWSKGPSFDCAFLKQAYINCNKVSSEPWNFWEERDVRTRESAFSDKTGNSPEPDYPKGTDHEPSHDVKKQALSVLIATRRI